MANFLYDILLVGFGAVGTMSAECSSWDTDAFTMQKSGKARVTAVARSKYRAVVEHGVHIQSAIYGDIPGWRPYRVVKSIEDALDRPYHYVVICSKIIPEVTKTPELVAPLLEGSYPERYPQPIYVLLQNGLNVERDLYNELKSLDPEEEPKIISAAVYIATTMYGSERIIVHHNHLDRISMGVYRQSLAITFNTPAESALLSEFGGILSAGGTDVKVYSEIQREKFKKNFWNAASGIVAALTRLPTEAIFMTYSNTIPPPSSSKARPYGKQATNSERPSVAATSHLPRSTPAVGRYTIPWMHDLMQEIYTIGTVLYPPTDTAPGLPPNLVANTLEVLSSMHSGGSLVHHPSTLVDVEYGRPTEVEVILGELVRMGHQHGVAIPRLESLYALMLIVQGHLLYGQDVREGNHQSADAYLNQLGLHL